MSAFSPSTIVLHLLLLAVTSNSQTPDTCEEANTTVFHEICPNALSIIQFTRLPNVHGHSQRSDAETALSRYSAVVRSGCGIDIELFVCLYFFPTCRETSKNIPKVQPPCRDFCLRIQNSDCGTEIAAERQSLDCSLLPPFDSVEPTSCYDPYHLIVINEVNFGIGPSYVEFWDFGMKNTVLDSFQVVFFDPLGGVAESFNLNGRTTRSEYFAIGGIGSNIQFNRFELTGAVALYRNNR